METTVNPEYQKLIDIIDGVLASSVFSQEMKSRLTHVKEGLKNLGTIPKLDENVERFRHITFDMTKTYIDKNHDYGNSFDKSLDKFGLIASMVRMEDKMNRLTSLIDKKAKVKDESVKDTLLDLANYCIMTAMWINKNDSLNG